MKEMVRGERALGVDGGCGRGAVRSQALVLAKGYSWMDIMEDITEDIKEFRHQ